VLQRARSVAFSEVADTVLELRERKLGRFRLPFATNPGASLSCFVLPAEHTSVLPRGSAESVEPV
jgi:hypothetical protein